MEKKNKNKNKKKRVNIQNKFNSNNNSKPTPAPNVQQIMQPNIQQNIQGYINMQQSFQPQQMMQYQHNMPQNFQPQFHPGYGHNYVNNNMATHPMYMQSQYHQMQHHSHVIPMQSQQSQQSQQTQHIPYENNYNVHDMNNNNSVKRRFDGNDIGYNEPLGKRQKLDENTLVIPQHVVQQQNKIQIEDFKERMRAEKFYKDVNEVVNNIYYIGQNIQIKDSQSGAWINAVVIDKENNWIVAHFDGCSSIYDQQIHVIKNKNKIRNLDGNKKDNEKKEEKDEEEVPDEFCDPITFEPMKEPTLVVVSGVTYEKSVIEEYIKENGQDPMTRQAVTIDQLVPNRALRDAIERWMKNHPGVIE